MNKELPVIDFAESRRVIQRAQARHAAGKRLSAKDRTIVQLAGLLKQAVEETQTREKEMALMAPVGRGGSGRSWAEGVTVQIPNAVTHVVGLVPKDLLNRIEDFADGVRQAVLVAGNGILVGEQRALQLLLNDYLRVFRPEIEEVEKRGE